MGSSFPGSQDKSNMFVPFSERENYTRLRIRYGLCRVYSYRPGTSGEFGEAALFRLFGRGLLSLLDSLISLSRCFCQTG